MLALRERPIPASFAPLGVYIYAVGSESCRNRLTLEGSAPLIDIAFGDSASLRGIPAAAPTVAARGTLGSWVKATHACRSLRGKARLFPRAASTTRVTMLRRRNAASLPRSRLVSHHANQSLAVPLRLLLARVALPRPSIRRVFLRSICARQCTIGSLNNFRKISPLHSGRFCDIMFTSCECGAMAQRGEIQCAESQFALQSSRLVEREKFRKAILSRESAYALPLFVFLTRLLTASPEIRTRGFFCSSAEWRALKVRQFLGAFVMNL